ncbi:MAG: ABC transporter permease subunit [Clostridia bacterium]|nr:ABC transporter permease subunit [Clostridia bacterium]
MFAIFKKELRAYFISPVGYVYTGIFLAVSALICAMTTIQQMSYDTSSYFQYMIFAFVVLIPLLTMRLFSEERKTHTEQLLLTAPVTITGMVIGKFLAALALFASTMVVSCINFFPLISFSIVEQSTTVSDVHVGPVFGQVFGCFVGVLLIGACFIAVGLFISALTENQLSAAVITVAAIVGMIMVSWFNPYIPVAWIRSVLDWVSVLSRFDYFVYGIFDFSALLYYISIAGVFVFLTVRVYDKRRWG